MKTVAICCTVGRASLDELLGMWALQSVSIPLFLALDVDASRWIASVPIRVAPRDSLGLGVEWIGQRAPDRVRRDAYPRTIGPLRAWAVEQATKLWALDVREDSFLVLDDDDYYAPHHARATMQALTSYGGQCVVGARDFGIVWQEGQAEPEMVRGGPHGPGPHATWGMPLRLYHAAGGYQTDPVEDLALLSRIGWHSARSHFEVTHVRSQESGVTVSATSGDRAAMETAGEVPILPRLTPRLERLQGWCNAHQP